MWLIFFIVAVAAAICFVVLRICSDALRSDYRKVYALAAVVSALATLIVALGRLAGL
jgi:hypothetical protein